RLGFANIIGGIVVVDLLGAVWFSIVTGMSVLQSFIVGALVFIPGDLAKAVIAAVITVRINKQLGRNQV
ncbi:MAG: bioY, partial [Clostridia bacterium]|nr:bioY [Clostridia bacterium]